MDDKLNKLFNKIMVESKTFAEAKKSRTRKTALRILHKTMAIERRTLVLSTFRQHHKAAQITTQVCSHCDGEQEIVDFIHVWSHSPLKGIDTAEITTVIRGRGMWDFHADLPLVIQRAREYIPICAKCLITDYNSKAEEQRAQVG